MPAAGVNPYLGCDLIQWPRGTHTAAAARHEDYSNWQTQDNSKTNATAYAHSYNADPKRQNRDQSARRQDLHKTSSQKHCDPPETGSTWRDSIGLGSGRQEQPRAYRQMPGQGRHSAAYDHDGGQRKRYRPTMEPWRRQANTSSANSEARREYLEDAMNNGRPEEKRPRTDSLHFNSERSRENDRE